jgi:L-lactate dehydrogenase complex protein LldE
VVRGADDGLRAQNEVRSVTEKRRQVALAPTCVVDMLAPEVAFAAVRVLRSAGCDVHVATGQTCCGQPAWNSGFAPEAARVARQMLTALAEVDAPVVVLAGSCATMMRVYWPELFRLTGDDEARRWSMEVGARMYELSELLDQLDLPPMRLAHSRSVAYHHSCHMMRELSIHDAPLRLVDRVENCSRAEWRDAERCCGFGGTFSVKLPETAVAIADEKLDSLVEAGSDEVLGCDTSCLAHLRARSDARRLGVRFRHLAELLDESMEGG